MTYQQSLNKLFKESLGTDILPEDLTGEVMNLTVSLLDTVLRFISDDERVNKYMDMFSNDIDEPMFEFMGEGNDISFDLGEFFDFAMSLGNPVKLDDVWVVKGKNNKFYSFAYIQKQLISKKAKESKRMP